MKVISLDEQVFRGKEITFSYTSDRYYDVIHKNTEKGWTVDFEEKLFDKGEQTFTYTDTLFEWYVINPLGFAVTIEGHIKAWLLIRRDYDAKRIRIDDLLVEQEYRNKGIGMTLIQKVIEIAKEEKMTVIVLETQTCNYKAINFYKKAGFIFSGVDFNCYSNNDIEKKQVRIEMSYYLNDE